jgi:hypothetical protein
MYFFLKKKEQAIAPPILWAFLNLDILQIKRQTKPTQTNDDACA